MIDFSRIKMPKLVFKLEQKGYFKALGLHHGSISLILLGISLLVAWLGSPILGAFIVSIPFGWYGSREYGNGPYPPKTFEFMDFVSPAIVSIAYFPLKDLIS